MNSKCLPCYHPPTHADFCLQEGVCAVVLKTLSQALRDGDQIDCVIRETGLNQDGRTTGITMPSHDAQEALIRSVYDRAGLDITKREDRCQFFEAHGEMHCCPRRFRYIPTFL